MNEITEKNTATHNHKTDEKKKKRTVLLIVLLILLVVGVLLFFLLRDGGTFSSVPTVTIETPDKKSVSDREPFSLQVQLSALGEDSYPAASFSIGFDPSKLEFIGLDEGNVIISNSDNAYGVSLPEWSVNVERANETGVINIMYLDMTGGRYAFSGDLLEDDNVLFFLNFRLRGSVRAGDILELSLDDAVFAANDEKKSLASNKNTLKTVNGRVVIGE